MERKMELKCPRCQGFVIVDKDLNGWYQLCLQCGYQRDIRDLKEIKETTRFKDRASQQA